MSSQQAAVPARVRCAGAHTPCLARFGRHGWSFGTIEKAKEPMQPPPPELIEAKTASEFAPDAG
jgi:hypothetical protein